MIKIILLIFSLCLILLYSVFITYVYFLNHSIENIWNDILYSKDIIVTGFDIVKFYSTSQIESIEVFMTNLLTDTEHFYKCLIYGCDHMKRTIFINSKFEDFLQTYQENKSFIEILLGILYGIYQTYTTAMKIVFLVYYLIFSDQFIADMIMYHVITHLLFTLPREFLYRILASTNFISLWRFQKLGNFLLTTGIYNTLSETITWLIVIRIILLAIGLPWVLNVKSIYLISIVVIYVFYRTLKHIHNEVSYKIELKIHADILLKKKDENNALLAIKNNYVKEMMSLIEKWWEGVPLITILYKYSTPFRPFYGLHAPNKIIYYLTWPILIVVGIPLFIFDILLYMIVWSIIFFWFFPYLDNKRIAPGLWDKMTNAAGLRSIFVSSEYLFENEGYFYLLIRTILLTLGWEGTDPISFNRRSSFILFFQDFYRGTPKDKSLKKMLEKYSQDHDIDLRYVNANFMPNNPTNKDRAYMMLQYWKFKGKRIAPLHPNPELIYFTGPTGIHNKMALELAKRMITEELAKLGIPYPFLDSGEFDPEYNGIKELPVQIEKSKSSSSTKEESSSSSLSDDEVELVEIDSKNIEIPDYKIKETNEHIVGNNTYIVDRKDVSQLNGELLVFGKTANQFKSEYELKIKDDRELRNIYIDIDNMFTSIKYKLGPDGLVDYKVTDLVEYKGPEKPITKPDQPYFPEDYSKIREKYVEIFPPWVRFMLNKKELVQRAKEYKMPYNKDFIYDLMDIPDYVWITEEGYGIRKKLLNSVIKDDSDWEHIVDYDNLKEYLFNKYELTKLTLDRDYFVYLIRSYLNIINYLPRVVYTLNKTLYGLIPHFKKPLNASPKLAMFVYGRPPLFQHILGKFLTKGSLSLQEYDAPSIIAHMRDQCVNISMPYILAKLLEIEEYRQAFMYLDDGVLPETIELPRGYIYGTDHLVDVAYKKFLGRLMRCRSFSYSFRTYLSKFPEEDRPKVCLYILLTPGKNTLFFQRFFTGTEIFEMIAISGIPRSYALNLMFVKSESQELINYNNLVRQHLNQSNAKFPSEFLQLIQSKEVQNTLTKEDLQKVLDYEKLFNKTHDVIYQNKEFLTYTPISPKVIKGLEIVGYQNVFNMKPRAVFRNEGMLADILRIDKEAPYDVYAPSKATEDLAFQAMSKYIPIVSFSFNRIYSGVNFKTWAFNIIDQFLNINDTFVATVRKLSDLSLNDLSRDSRKAYAGKEMAAFGYRNKEDRFSSQIKYAEAFREKVLTSNEVSHSWAGLFVPKTEKLPKKSVRVVLAPESYFYYNHYLLFQSFVELMNQSKITNKFNPFFKNFDHTCAKLSRDKWMIQSLDLVSMGGRIPVEVKDFFIEWYSRFLQSRSDRILLKALLDNIFDCQVWLPTSLGGHIVHKKQGWGDGPYGTNQFDTWTMLVYYLYGLFRYAEDEGLSLTMYNNIIDDVVIESHGDNWIHSMRDSIIYSWRPKYLKELGQEIKDSMKTSYQITDHELMGYNIKIHSQVYVGYRPYAKTIKTLYYNKRSFKNVDSQRAYENGILRSIFLTDCMNPLSSRLIGSLVGPRMKDPTQVYSEQEALHLWILENLSYQPERAWLEENPSLVQEYEEKQEYALDIPSPKSTEREADAEESSRSDLKS